MTAKFFTTSTVFAQMYQFSLNLKLLRQKFSLTSNYLGINSVVVKRVDCMNRTTYGDWVLQVYSSSISTSPSSTVLPVVKLTAFILPLFAATKLFCIFIASRIHTSWPSETWKKVMCLWNTGLYEQKFWAKIVNIFLPISLNICFGCSKEPSHWGGSFQYPQHMFWLRNKKNYFLVCTLNQRPSET